jgi:mRNA interferase MazF
MRIEFIEHASDGPAVLLWGNEPATVALLREHVSELARETLNELVVHELPGFEAVDGCKLTFVLTRRDRGVRPAEDGGFVCELRSSADIFNERSGTVIAVGLTSQPPRAGFPLTLELDSADLPKASWAKISQVRTLSTERIGDLLGTASPEQLTQVMEGLNEILGA